MTRELMVLEKKRKKLLSWPYMSRPKWVRDEITELDGLIAAEQAKENESHPNS